MHTRQKSHKLIMKKNILFSLVGLFGALLFVSCSAGNNPGGHTVTQVATNCPPGRPNCAPTRAGSMGGQSVTIVDNRSTTFSLLAHPGMRYGSDARFRQFGGIPHQRGFQLRIPQPCPPGWQQGGQWGGGGFGGRPPFVQRGGTGAAMIWPAQGPPGSPGGAYRVGGLAGSLRRGF